MRGWVWGLFPGCVPLTPPRAARVARPGPVPLPTQGRPLHPLACRANGMLSAERSPRGGRCLAEVKTDDAVRIPLGPDGVPFGRHAGSERLSLAGLRG